MVLAFDDCGLLLPGIHDVPLETVKAHFGRFQRSDRRMALYAKLAAYIDEVKRAGFGASVIIDGSFVMVCVDEPDDIDIILALPANWDDTADLRPLEYNLVSGKRVKKDFGFDLFTVSSGSTDEAEMIAFFEQVNFKWRQKFGWAADRRKGLVRVKL